MKFSNNKLLVVLGLVCLSLGLFVIFNGPVTQPSPTAGLPGSDIFEAIELEGPARENVGKSQSARLHVFDHDSATLVEPMGDLGLRTQAGTEWSLPFSSAELGQRLLELKSNEEGELTYLVPSIDQPTGMPWTSALAETKVWVNDEGNANLSLPFLPSVSIRVQGVDAVPLADVPVDLFLLSHGGFQRAQSTAQDNAQIAKSAYPFKQIENVLLGYQSLADIELERVVRRTDDLGLVQAVLPQAGLLVVVIADMEHRLYWRSAPIQPGTNGTISCVLSPRPRVAGRVTHLDGSPAPNIRVSLGTYLVSDGIDYSGTDRHGGSAMSGIKKADGTVHRVVRKSVMTNGNGDYSATIPFGIQYMTEVKTSNYYESVIHANGDLNEDGVLRQDFKIPSAADVALSDSEVVSMEIVSPLGEVLKNVSVGMAPYLDEPWFRVYPKTNTGEDGYVDLPWVSIGDSIMVILKHDSWAGIRTEIVTVESSLVTVKIVHDNLTEETPPGWEPGGSFTQ